MRHTPTWAWILVLGLVLPPFSAAAGQGENAVTLGLSYENLLQAGDSSKGGFGIAGGYRYGLRDDWNLFSNAGYQAYFGPGDRLDQVSVVAGAAYVVDATTWVPEIYGGLGYFGPASVSALDPNLGVVVGVGMEYRRVRDFGVGVRFEYRVFVFNRDVSPQSSALTLMMTRYF